MNWNPYRESGMKSRQELPVNNEKDEISSIFMKLLLPSRSTNERDAGEGA